MLNSKYMMGGKNYVEHLLDEKELGFAIAKNSG
jgi:hypothetical protein